MRVLMLLANPFTNDARVYNEATSLIKAGHGVTVIAWDRERDNPLQQTVDGIEVVRLSTRIALRYGPFSWLWNMSSLLVWQRQAYRWASLMNRERRFDVVHCHDLDTLSIGARLKRKLGIPLIYDAHEIYGYMMARSIPRLVTGMLFWLEKRLVRRVDRVINVGEAQSRYFAGITDKPITIIMNCKPLRSLQYHAPDNKDMSLLYIGSLHPVRTLPMLVRVAKELPRVRCLIGGIGRPDFVQMLEKECASTSNVRFLGKVPLDAVLPMTMKADVVFCMFDPADPNSSIGTPNKLFEAMACGRPIICTRGTYSGDLTQQEEVGLAVDYNEQALRDAITKLRDDPALRERLGRNALKAAIDKYSWERQEEKLVEVYEQLVISDR